MNPPLDDPRTTIPFQAQLVIFFILNHLPVSFYLVRKQKLAFWSCHSLVCRWMYHLNLQFECHSASVHLYISIISRQIVDWTCIRYITGLVIVIPLYSFNYTTYGAASIIIMALIKETARNSPPVIHPFHRRWMNRRWSTLHILLLLWCFSSISLCHCVSTYMYTIFIQSQESLRNGGGRG